jgi:hypothetical protein
MAKFKNRFTYIATEATECCYTWTNKEQAQFHYFNPNGVYAQKKAMDERISAAVDAGRCKSGSIIAHGTFNYYSSNRLTDMAQQKRVLGRSLRVTIDMMKRDLESAEAFLASLPPAAATEATEAAEVALAAIEAPEAAQEAVEAVADVETCKCCDRLLNPQRTVWLEMSISKGYTSEPGVIPEAQSQGWFAFGLKCAAKALAAAPYEAPEASQEAAADTVTVTLTAEQARAVRIALRARMSICITQELSAVNPAGKEAWDARFVAANDALQVFGGVLPV